MSDDLYSPDTGEHIVTDNPQDWMQRAGTPAPAYDRKIEGCFWRGNAWEIVQSLPVTPERSAIIPAYVFRDRFTVAELMAINALAYSGDATAQLLLIKVSTATDGIDLTSQSVVDGLNYLVSVGAITADRLPAILALA